MSATETTKPSSMHLRLLLPTEILVDEDVQKVNAEAANGSFCLLPRHVDFVAALVPGILSFHTLEGAEKFAGIDDGVLVKRGNEVSVSTLNAIIGDDLEHLQDQVEAHFLQLDEHERRTRSALARLEAGTLRGFRELQERFRG